jgi:hypothetical protein
LFNFAAFALVWVAVETRHCREAASTLSAMRGQFAGLFECILIWHNLTILQIVKINVNFTFLRHFSSCPACA